VAPAASRRGLSPGQPIYIALYASLIMFFCFFYTALVFNSRRDGGQPPEVGRVHPGHPAGAADRQYIDKVLTRLTFWGAIYITIVCLVPEFMILEFNNAVLVRRRRC
jgi:preprotein translocase subunit SecY